MSEYAVELRNVVKKFPAPEGDEVTAVDHIELLIENGEFFSLLGPSGCGKTTSLRMIGGFEWPTSGDVFIKGEPMGRKPPFQRPVNTVFQSYALFQHMTVAQNVAFGLEMDHVSKPEIIRRVGEALEMVRLARMGERRPGQLSGGQQQRVALARALIRRPAVLLLDEPLGALDLKLRKEMQMELKELQSLVGITFIYVTHDQEEALTMSDRIAVMSKGKVLQIGSPVEIYERPNNRFVADFIGESNFLTGVVESVKGDQATVTLDRLGIPLVGTCVGDFPPGSRACVSIRPEKMHLTDRCVGDVNCFRAKVVQSAYVGADTRVVIDLGADTRLRVWEQNRIATLVTHAGYAPSQELWISLFPENTLILPES